MPEQIVILHSTSRKIVEWRVEYYLYKLKRFKNKTQTICKKEITPVFKNTGGLFDPPVKFVLEEICGLVTILTAAGSTLDLSKKLKLC